MHYIHKMISFLNEYNYSKIITSKLPTNMQTYTFLIDNNKILNSKVPKFTEVNYIVILFITIVNIWTKF